jgi:two-component system, LytTR family, sensor kinase
MNGLGLRRRAARNFALIFAAWTAFGLFFVTQDLTRKAAFGDATPAWNYVVSWLIGVWVSALLTPGILWLGRRFPIERRRWVRRAALHLAASVAYSLVQLTSESAIIARLPVLQQLIPKNFAATFFVLFVIGFHGNIVSYWTILVIQHAVRNYQRYQEREREALRLSLDAAQLKSQLVGAQLAGLKTQLQPHFLFNTLNAIMVLVRQRRTDQAEAMISRLSDLLRRVLDEAAAQEVPLRHELELVDLYLSIEQVRFADRLRVAIAADSAVLDAAVPHLGLQPLVENAVRHGIGRRSAAGRIDVHASRVGDQLMLSVRDDGPGLSPVTLTGTPRGIGLTNTRERLRQLYGDRATLDLRNGEHGGAVATVVLPFHLAPAPRLAAAEAVTAAAAPWT